MCSSSLSRPHMNLTLSEGEIKYLKHHRSLSGLCAWTCTGPLEPSCGWAEKTWVCRDGWLPGDVGQTAALSYHLGINERISSVHRQKTNLQPLQPVSLDCPRASGWPTMTKPSGAVCAMASSIVLAVIFTGLYDVATLAFAEAPPTPQPRAGERPSGRGTRRSR